ncbi:MAG TPA: tyrosine-protein phosphatase [Novosphingobium sp.]|nr:tyrosine-protein phosphatase [Novosphingobium sp.]
MSQDRVLALEGVHNFRDHGGYAVAGGGRLKRGVLWRSGQHHGASDADLEAIAALSLASVLDLRSSVERDRHPCRRPGDFSATVVFSDDPPPREKRMMLAPHVAAAAEAQARPRRDPAEVRAAMVRNYAGIAWRPELVAAIRLYLAELAQGRGPSLVNCMAGKDRTGIAVAMLHHALGVHPDDVMADYLLTNTAGDVEARVRAGMETMRASSGEVDEEVMRIMMMVEPEWLEAVYARVRADHGGIEGYLRDVLGVDQALRDKLRAALVEG